MTTQRWLMSLAFTMLCSIIGYILCMLAVWFFALFSIGAWVFTLAAGGGASG